MAHHRHLSLFLFTALSGACVLPHAEGIDVVRINDMTDVDVVDVPSVIDRFDVPNERPDIVTPVDEDVVLPLDEQADVADVMDVPNPIDVPDRMDVPNPDVPNPDVPNFDVPTPVDSGVLPVRWSVDFLPVAAGALPVLPGNLRVLRNSRATVQTNAQTVSLPMGNDLARVGDTGIAVQHGLVIEEARTNSLCQSRDLTNGMGGNNSCDPWNQPDNVVAVTSNFSPGPDGNMLADRFDIRAARPAWSRGADAQPGGGRQLTGTFWGRRNNGMASVASGTRLSGGANTPITLQDEWRRFVSGTVSANSRFHPVFVTNMQAADIDEIVDMAQLEEGFWPSEFIVGPVADIGRRAGEQLSHTLASELYSGGQLALEFDLAPKGASTEYTADMRLFTIDGNNYAHIDSATQRLVVRLGGQTNTFPTVLVWGRGDRVQIFIRTSPLTAAYSVNGGATRFAELTPPAMIMGSLVAAPATMDLLCNGASNQFSSWVRGIRAYNAGFRPVYP